MVSVAEFHRQLKRKYPRFTSIQRTAFIIIHSIMLLGSWSCLATHQSANSQPSSVPLPACSDLKTLLMLYVASHLLFILKET